MKNTRIKGLIGFVLVVGLALASSGCAELTLVTAGLAYKGITATVEPVNVKGYTCDIAEVKCGGFMTPSRLPENIKQGLAKKLSEKGLLASASPSEKRLLVNIETGASYPAFAQSDEYNEIQSHIRVIDVENKDLIAETTIRTLNSFNWDGDFTESIHAKHIGSYLEGIVR
jgi:hypothetical protein